MGDIYLIEFPNDIYDRFVEKKGQYLILLNLPSRKVYREGNILTVSQKNGDKKHQIKIKNILYFNTIKEAVEMLGKNQIGYTSSFTADKIEDIFTTYNKPADLDKYGVMAINFENV